MEYLRCFMPARATEKEVRMQLSLTWNKEPPVAVKAWREIEVSSRSDFTSTGLGSPFLAREGSVEVAREAEHQVHLPLVGPGPFLPSHESGGLLKVPVLQLTFVSPLDSSTLPPHHPQI